MSGVVDRAQPVTVADPEEADHIFEVVGVRPVLELDGVDLGVAAVSPRLKKGQIDRRPRGVPRRREPEVGPPDLEPCMPGVLAAARIQPSSCRGQLPCGCRALAWFLIPGTKKASFVALSTTEA